MRDKTLEMEKRRIVRQKIKDFELKQQQDAAAAVQDATNAAARDAFMQVNSTHPHTHPIIK